jgi:hypothetical protein
MSVFLQCSKLIGLHLEWGFLSVLTSYLLDEVSSVTRFSTHFAWGKKV